MIGERILNIKTPALVLVSTCFPPLVSEGDCFAQIIEESASTTLLNVKKHSIYGLS
jgi:hypothetical protein